VPLAIYLTSFALVFARQPMLPHRTMSALLPLRGSHAIGHVCRTRPAVARFLVFPLFALFVVAMVCHGELASSRPAVVHLTDFYLWISAGGAIGGLFNAVVAPLVFKTGIEYPLGLILACLVAAKELKVKIRGRQRAQKRSEARTELKAPSRLRIGAEIIAVALLVVALEFAAARVPLPVGSVRFVVLVFAAPILIALWLRRDRIRLALVLGAIVLAAHLYNDSNIMRSSRRSGAFMASIAFWTAASFACSTTAARTTARSRSSLKGNVCPSPITFRPVRWGVSSRASKERTRNPI
jgi:hypothetical protein